jgi:hypothetical protein
MCGKFVKFKHIIVDGFGDVKQIIGECKTHCEMDVKDTADWWYEDFFPEGSEVD